MDKSRINRLFQIIFLKNVINTQLIRKIVRHAEQHRANALLLVT